MLVGFGLVVGGCCGRCRRPGHWSWLSAGELQTHRTTMHPVINVVAVAGSNIRSRHRPATANQAGGFDVFAAVVMTAVRPFTWIPAQQRTSPLMPQA